MSFLYAADDKLMKSYGRRENVVTYRQRLTNVLVKLNFLSQGFVGTYNINEIISRYFGERTSEPLRLRLCYAFIVILSFCAEISPL